jgi:hypothetical protein
MLNFFNDKRVNSFIKLKSNLILKIIFIVLSGFFIFSTNDILAQPNSFAPVDGGKGSEGNTNSNDNKAGGDKNFTPQQIDEIREAKNIWKTELNEENIDESNKLMVKYDSLYQYYASIRKAKSNTSEDIVYKIYPNFILPKIHGNDTSIFKCMVTENKYYSKFELNREKLTDKMQSNLQIFDQMTANYKFKSSEVFNNLLPPLVIVEGRKMKPSEYEKFLTDFFGNNPELIYLCSKRFVSLIENKQYDKLMKLQRTSTNTLDFRDQARLEQKDTKSK